MNRGDNQIYDVLFASRTHPRIGCDALTLQTLFRRKLDHRLDRPQRVHFFLMMLFTRGEGHHVIDFKRHAYRTGALMCVAENQVQQFEIQPDSDALAILFTKAFLYQHADDADMLARFRLFDVSLQSPTTQLSDDDYEQLLALFNEIKHEIDRKDEDVLKEDILHNLVRLVILRAERLKQAKPAAFAQSNYADYSRFKDQLEEDFTRTRNVNDYARQLGLSVKTLNHLTRTTVNKSAKAFIDERVVLEIKRLLTHTDMPLKAIADQTGFDEPTNAVKFFKRHTHQTPMAFREGLRGMEEYGAHLPSLGRHLP